MVLNYTTASGIDRLSGRCPRACRGSRGGGVVETRVFRSCGRERPGEAGPARCVVLLVRMHAEPRFG